MSNTTQTRYVRILPSAVESKYGWSEESINTIWKLHKDKVNYYVIVGGKESLAFVSHIEPEHVQEVHVYDEPQHTKPFCRNHHNGTDRIAELEKRVAKLEEQRRSDAKQPEPQQESNLDKARRLYPKGVRFKSVMTGHERVSNGDFREVETGIFLYGCGWVFRHGQWAEVVQPEVKQWRLKVDVQEWGLKKGQQTDNVVAGFAKFSWQDYTASIPLSIMPYIADPVGMMAGNGRVLPKAGI